MFVCSECCVLLGRGLFYRADNCLESDKNPSFVQRDRSSPCSQKPATESWFLVITRGYLKMPIHEQDCHKVSLLRPKSGGNSEVC
jgi:hypothetical protein